MSQKNNHFAEAAMLIRKPLSEVFNAFIDPAVTTKFWFTKSTGILEEGEKVEWSWEMYNVNVPVEVRSISPNERILIQWGDNPEEEVEWTFKSLGENKTFVHIMNTGLKGDQEALITQVRESTGGFTWVLSGLKAYLEYGIELNLIADRFPPELSKQ